MCFSVYSPNIDCRKIFNELSFKKICNSEVRIIDSFNRLKNNNFIKNHYGSFIIFYEMRTTEV